MRLLLSETAVGAPIGRPFCPLRSGRFSAERQFCFRRAADGRPYVGKQTFYKKLLKGIDVAHVTHYNKKKAGVILMSDVRSVFTTSEVAAMIGVSSSYLLRLTQTMNFSPAEFRSAGKRNYLYSEAAVEKLKNRK